MSQFCISEENIQVLNQNKENESKVNIDFNSFLAANLQKSLYLKEDLLK